MVSVLLIGSEPETVDTDRQHVSFPYLDLKGMSKDEKQELHQRLYAESVDIMFKFQDLFTETTKSLKERNISTKDLSNHLMCLGSLKPTYDDSEGSAFRHQLPRLRHTDLVDDACVLSMNTVPFSTTTSLSLL